MAGWTDLLWLSLLKINQLHPRSQSFGLCSLRLWEGLTGTLWEYSWVRYVLTCLCHSKHDHTCPNQHCYWSSTLLYRCTLHILNACRLGWALSRCVKLNVTHGLLIYSQVNAHWLQLNPKLLWGTFVIHVQSILLFREPKIFFELSLIKHWKNNCLQCVYSTEPWKQRRVFLDDSFVCHMVLWSS